MPGVTVGQMAPSFRLPSGQGPEVGSEDFRGKKNVIVWFTKGLACSFCRQHMSQLVRGYPQFRERDAEVLEVTSSALPRAKVYLQRFNVPFPYLCDPDYSVHRQWNLDARSHSPVWWAKTFVASIRMTPPPGTEEFGPAEPPALPDMKQTMTDEDVGFFIVDKQGIVRYSTAGMYVTESGIRPIPTNDEILRELDRCQRGAG
jgi:peroxiredoxin